MIPLMLKRPFVASLWVSEARSAGKPTMRDIVITLSRHCHQPQPYHKLRRLGWSSRRGSCQDITVHDITSQNIQHSSCELLHGCFCRHQLPQHRLGAAISNFDDLARSLCFSSMMPEPEDSQVGITTAYPFSTKWYEMISRYSFKFSVDESRLAVMAAVIMYLSDLYAMRIETGWTKNETESDAT